MMRKPKASLRAGFDDLLVRANRISLPESSYAHLLQRLDRKRPRRWLLVTSMAFASAVVLTFLYLPRRTTAGPFEVASASNDFAWRLTPAGQGTVQATAGSAVLAMREYRTRIGIRQGSRLRPEGQGVRLIAGTADFQVEPRSVAVALRVLVSHGAIEVTGTRFEVEQNERSGRVILKEGHIRFVANTGERRSLEPGQQLAWPLPAPPAEVSPNRQERETTPAPKPSVLKQPTVRHRAFDPPRNPEIGPLEIERKYLTEIDALRIRHDYRRLAERLAAALKDPLREPLRESLSYELCDVLLHRTSERERACAQIADHVRRYPTGSYTPRLVQMKTAMGCPP